MASVTLKGAIVAIFDSQIVGTNFEKRIFWLKEQGVEFPQTYNLEMQQGDCNKLDKYKLGDLVECQVSIRGRAGKKRDGTGEYCINTLKVWSIIHTKSLQGSNNSDQGNQVTPPRNRQDYSVNENESDDLPF